MFARMRFSGSAALALAAVLMAPGCHLTGWKRSAETKIDETPEPDSPLVANPDAPIGASTFIAAGRLHESQGRDLQAVQQYRRAVKADPKDVDTLNRLAMALCRLGSFREAADTLAKALQLGPDKAYLHNNLAFAYICESRWQEAEVELVRALELAPDFARARVNLGMTLAQQDRFDEAFEQFRLVLPVAEAHFNVGLMHQSKRQVIEAAQRYKQALDANPGLVAARKRLDMMPAETLSAAEQKLKEAAEARALAAAQQQAEALAATRAEADAAAAPEAQARSVAQAETRPAAEEVKEVRIEAIPSAELSSEGEAGSLPEVQPAALLGTPPMPPPAFADEEWFYPAGRSDDWVRDEDVLPVLKVPAGDTGPAAPSLPIRRAADALGGLSRSLHEWIAPLADRIDQRFRNTVPLKLFDRLRGTSDDTAVLPAEPADSPDPLIAQ